MSLTACGGGGGAVGPALPPVATSLSGVADHALSACNVSADGVLWYAVPAGSFSPIDATQSGSCTLSLTTPVIPAWAKPQGSTKALFVATSLQEAYSMAGMQMLETAASGAHVPMTWLLKNATYLSSAPLYTQFHVQNGDDVQTDSGSVPTLRATFPWYTPSISAEGAGHERAIAADLSAGLSGFWGMSWDSQGIDGTDDLGAPWGNYCADPTSYKRPQPDGGCAMLAFEWTARDLTRAYLSRLDYWYSTDPDDLILRAGFDANGASQYVRSIMDAYAAAGETTPLVVISQQETAEETNPGDQTVMTSLYSQAVADGMKAETFTQANVDARAFSAAPRAVAFPMIPGGTGSTYPATIDFHDTQVGLTFIAGHTLPARAFRYADDVISTYTQMLAALPSNQMPTLQSAAVSGGQLVLSINAPTALHYGVALWSNPVVLGISGPNVYPAGRAGAVVTFDLQPGVNQVSIRCTSCTSTTLPYST